MKKLGFILTMVLAVSIPAFADIARPDKSPSRVPKPKETPGISTFMEIRLDKEAKEARLLIPRSQIKQLRAELEQLDTEPDNTAAVTSSGSFSRTQTIVSGIFLSLAFVFGGIWFVRSGKTATKASKGMIVLAAVAGIASAATLVYANVGPPPEARSITSKLFDQKIFFPYRFASGKIKVEVTDGENVRLIVPDVSDATKPGE
jgi:hypothetical protein